MSSRMFLDASGNPFPAIQPYIVQAVAFTTATSSSAFNKNTTLVELVPTANCWVSFGTNPTATKPGGTAASGASFYIAAGTSKFYCVQPNWVVSVIQDSTGGTLSVIEAQ